MPNARRFTKNHGTLTSTQLGPFTFALSSARFAKRSIYHPQAQTRNGLKTRDDRTRWTFVRTRSSVATIERFGIIYFTSESISRHFRSTPIVPNATFHRVPTTSALISRTPDSVYSIRSNSPTWPGRATSLTSRSYLNSIDTPVVFDGYPRAVFQNVRLKRSATA